MDGQKFRSLSAHDRAIVALAVLLDGREAAAHLSLDAVNGAVLKRAALDCAEMAPELRMPFLGTMLRQALAEVKAKLR